MQMTDVLNKHLMTSTVLHELEMMDGYRIMIRTIRNQIELYREENITLFEQEQKLTSEYSKLRGAMTIEYRGETLTLNQAATYLESQDRSVREEVYTLMTTRQSQDRDAVNIVLDKLIAIRHQIAQNAGFPDYVAYIYRSKNRFDYGVKQVMEFHDGVEKVITPLCKQFLDVRKKSLGLDVLKPFDLAVDIHGRESLQAFTGEEQAIDRTIDCLDAMDQDF
jgi:oligoendopeptidase F